MTKIFISYRREDTALLADVLRARLAQEHGPETIFHDANTIPLGVDFAVAIDKAIRGARVVLALVGDR